MKKKILVLLMLICFLCSSNSVLAAVLTPYDEWKTPDEFINGATFVLKSTSDTKAWITRELQTMKSSYNINTVTIYGLESFDKTGSNEYKDHLFAELIRLGMKIVVRIEAYDAKAFSFTAADAKNVVQNHRSIIEYVSDAQRREALRYFAINMPLDDGTVQKNLGGVNSQKAKNNQVVYAKEVVRLMREATAEYGFTSSKMFLSLFYGWDNKYEVPSYASANADGYFINNYSYPKTSILFDETASGEDIINADRLKISMQSFLNQYPNKPPVVIESGFHTLEYNNGEMPSQTGGLVKDRKTKEKALATIIDFYTQNYSNMCGLLYFGYNLFNEEGNPPAVMDWALVYPTKGQIEAENGAIGQGAIIENDDTASQKQAIKLENIGDSIFFAECPQVQQIKLMYKADKAVSVGLYVSDKLKKTIKLAQSDTYIEISEAVTVPEGYTLEIRIESAASLYLDKITMYEQLEAENADILGSARVNEDTAASNGAAVSDAMGAESLISFKGTRGGEKISITYKAPNGATLVLNNGSSFELVLPSSETYTQASAKLELQSGANFSIYQKGDGELFIDCVLLSGAPIAEHLSKNTAQSEASTISSDISANKTTDISGLIIIVLCSAVAFIILIAAVLFAKRKSKGRDNK